MKIVPRLPDEQVNLPQGSHLGWFVKLLAGLVAATALLYLMLGLVVEQLASRISVETETRIFSGLIALDDDDAAPRAAEQQAQALLDRLARQQPGLDYQLQVQIDCDDTVNALALPGGTVRLYHGLLERLDSENELAMVLAHEIGHFVRRDHLRALGRALVPLALATVLGLSGADSTVGQLLGSGLDLERLRYSRAQERHADLVGLRLLQGTYGHPGGATATFQHLELDDGLDSWLPEFLSTHPEGAARVTELEQRIAERGWVAQPPTALPEALRNACD